MEVFRRGESSVEVIGDAEEGREENKESNMGPIGSDYMLENSAG